MRVIQNVKRSPAQLLLDEIVTTDVPAAAMTLSEVCVFVCSVEETEFAPPPRGVVPIFVVAVQVPDLHLLST